MATSRSSITETFNAIAIGSNILECRGDSAYKLKYIAVQITGAFSGTIRLEAALPNSTSWALVQGGSFTLTGDGVSTIAQVAADEDIRLNCTLATAGVANCTLKFLN